MPGAQKSGFWSVKSGIFLLPPSYRDENIYPSPEMRDKLQAKGFGTCSFEKGLDRAWTRDELEEKIIAKYPRHAKLLRSTGILFAKLASSSKKIGVHRFSPCQTVADLETMHGNGVLVLLPRPPDVVQQDLARLWECDGIIIGHLNCQSLPPKIDELRLLLFRTNVDIMTLSETWLRNGNREADFEVAGYEIIERRDGKPNSENRPRGGVMVYVKAELAERCKCLNCDPSLEMVCVELDLGQPAKQTAAKGRASAAAAAGAAARHTDKCEQRKALRILDVYVPPGTRDQIAAFEKLVSNIHELKAHEKCGLLNKRDASADVVKRKGTKSAASKDAGGTTKDSSASTKGKTCRCKTNYVVLGDFNFDMKLADAAAAQRSTVESKLRTLKGMEESCQLKQLIKDPTRTERRRYSSKGEDNVTESIIDLIYTDNHTKVKSGVVRVSLSDHFMVYCSLTVPKRNCTGGAPVGNRDQEALRKFSSQYPRSKINKNVFQLIKDRDLAHANKQWDEYDRLRHEVKRLT
ncbi:uncharacterized protein [Diadema setosum]|uniref:uncharacterized protein n=1 Tax=Diadema setosum TaxID=31175 RepID=UPI003B3A460E